MAQLPNSPTGRGGNKIIEIFKTGSASIDAAYMQESFSEEFLAAPSPAERQTWLSEVVDRVGPLELRGVEKTDQFAATIIGRSSKTGESVEIRYEVADTEPHPIVRLEIEEGGGTQRQLTQAEMISEAMRYLEHLSPDEFSGTVLFAKGDQILLEKAIGQASRRYGVPNNLETLFNLGSINKIFTKIAIAQLASQGKLRFEDTVAKHLPDYPNHEVAKAITIQHVATHSAGLGDIFSDEFTRTSKRQFQTPRDYFGLFAGLPLLFEPGTSQRYSNGGYMVLGAIVEAASGMSYDEYVQQKIFDPAGMTATGSYRMDEPTPNLAQGYTRQELGDHADDGHHGHGHDPTAPWRENSFMIPFTGTPAGGGYSNAGDLLRFRHALTRYELLDSRYTEWVVTSELPAAAAADWGHGIGVAGGAPGVNAEVEIGSTFTVIALSNLDPPSASNVVRHLRDLIDSIVD
jgi:CubicO group peptidase (beta-lactamase class C family)